MSQQRQQLSQQKQQMSQQRQQVAGESESGLGLHHTGQISFDHSDLQFRVQDRTSCLVHPVFSLPRPVSFSSLVINLDVQVGIELTRGGDRERGYTEIGQIGRSFDRENLVIESGEGWITLWRRCE